MSYPGAFPPWPVKAVVHYSWTATMNPKQKKWTGRHIRFRLCLRTRSGKAFHLETADFQHAPRRRGPGRHDQRLSRQPRGNTGRRSPCRHEKNPGQESETGTGRKLIPFSFISFFPPVNRKERNIFSLRSPVLAVWGRADTIQIPAFCGAFGWHPRRNERHSHPSDAPGGYSRIFHLRTASKTVVKQKKKLNYSKIINHPKDVFPLKWIGEIQEI